MEEFLLALSNIYFSEVDLAYKFWFFFHQLMDNFAHFIEHLLV